MSKAASYIALLLGIIACAAVFIDRANRQSAIDRAMRQREAQLVQRYARMIQDVADEVNNSTEARQAATIEEALKLLREAITTQRILLINRQAPREPAEETSRSPSAAETSSDQSPLPAHSHDSVMNSSTRSRRLMSVNAIPAKEASAPAAQLPGQIAIAVDYDGNKEIALINSDGSGLTRLTDNPADDRDPSWSPDGQRIAFASDRSGHYQVYTMNSSGSDVVQLTQLSGNNHMPLWSPDDRHVAFISSQPDKSDLDVIELSGRNLNRLNSFPLVDADSVLAGLLIGGAPMWSRDGTRMAFTELHAESTSVVLVRSDGRGQRIEIPDARAPSWSPDGRQIAFIRNSSAYVATSVGSGIRRVLNENRGIAPVDSAPCWSPNGRLLMFTSGRETAEKANTDVYICDIDTGRLMRLTESRGFDLGLGWSPDGSRITFASDRDGRFRLYSMNADGQGVVQLTKEPTEIEASWRPIAATQVIAGR